MATSAEMKLSYAIRLRCGCGYYLYCPVCCGQESCSSPIAHYPRQSLQELDYCAKHEAELEAAVLNGPWPYEWGAHQRSPAYRNKRRRYDRLRARLDAENKDLRDVLKARAP